jgi:hypothetical protein
MEACGGSLDFVVRYVQMHDFARKFAELPVLLGQKAG